MSRGGRPSDAPPALAGRLLDLLEGPDDPGAVRGDLDEEFARHVLPRRGRRAARRWYWRQTLASVPALLSRRFGGDRTGREGWLARRRADLRYAVRALVRRPGTTLAITATFALALGANTAVFSVVWDILLRPLPYAHASRLVRIHPDELFYTQLSGAESFAEAATAFDAVDPWGRTLFTFTGEGVAEEARGALVTWSHFETLGARPALGRTFRREDAASWPYESVILSHGLWVRRFGADPLVVGRRVDVGGRPRTVVGVMGRDHVPIEPDWEAWAPLPLDAGQVEGMGLAMNARLAPGVSLEQAVADTRRAFADIWTRAGQSVASAELAEIRVIPLRDHLLGDASRPLQVLMATVLGILLLACVNVANLLMAQGEGRMAELAVRLSLGATRGRVTVQLVLETALTALAGGAAGLWMAWLAVGWASSRLPASLPRTGHLDVGAATWGFALVTTLAAALLSAALPVLRASAGGLRSAAGRSDARGGERSRRVGPFLVGLEVATAVVLVVGAGLLLRTLGALATVDPGFDPRGVAAVRVTPPPGRYDSDEAVTALYDRVEEELSSLSGVTSVGAIMFLPMTPGGAWSRFRTGAASVTREEAPSVSFRIVTPGYFDAMGMALSRGRPLTREDRATAPAVAVINEAAARALFPGDDPVGRRLYEGPEGETYRTVVGVVPDVRQTSLREGALPEIYLPLAQEPFRRMYVLVRTAGDPQRALQAAGSRLLEIDGDLVLSNVGALDGVVDANLAETRLLAQLLSLFGLVALALGAVGVYGVTAHAVSRRKREIGIRMALGSEGRSEAYRVVRHGMLPVVIGLVGGLALAVVAGRLLAGLLFEVRPLDPVTFTGVPALLGVVALASLAIPATRASRLDPVRTLRDE